MMTLKQFFSLFILPIVILIFALVTFKPDSSPDFGFIGDMAEVILFININLIISVVLLYIGKIFGTYDLTWTKAIALFIILAVVSYLLINAGYLV